jgi:hypothetical protein
VLPHVDSTPVDRFSPRNERTARSFPHGLMWRLAGALV